MTLTQWLEELRRRREAHGHAVVTDAEAVDLRAAIAQAAGGIQPTPLTPQAVDGGVLLGALCGVVVWLVAPPAAKTADPAEVAEVVPPGVIRIEVTERTFRATQDGRVLIDFVAPPDAEPERRAPADPVWDDAVHLDTLLSGIRPGRGEGVPTIRRHAIARVMRKSVTRGEWRQHQAMLGEAADALGLPGSPSWPDALERMRLRRDVDEAPALPEWVPIAERMPAEGAPVWLAFAGGDYVVPGYSDGERWQYDHGSGSARHASAPWTHWRPREPEPAPPPASSTRPPCGHFHGRYGCTLTACGYGVGS